MSSEFALATLRYNGQTCAAIAVQDHFYILDSNVDPDKLLGEHPTCLQLLQQWSTALPNLKTIASRITQGGTKAVSIPRASAEVLTPVIYPPKLLAIGANYSSHLVEMGLSPEKMVPMPYFMRPPTTSLVGPGKTVRKPRSTNQFDWEIELVVVLGKPLRHAKSPEEVEDAIAAYTVGLDLSCRDLQKSNLGIDVGRGKAQDTLAPCGPVLVPKENIKGGVRDLRLQLWVNDEQMIDSSTKEMLYSIEEQLMELSRYTTLEAGDMLYTGTPAGGATSHGFRWLEIGDRIKAEIEQVGTLDVEIISDE